MYGYQPIPPRRADLTSDSTKLTLLVVAGILGLVALIGFLISLRAGMQYLGAEALASWLHSPAVTEAIRRGALGRLIVGAILTLLFGGGAVTTMVFAVRRPVNG